MSTDRRIEELEVKVAFHEETIETLSRSLAALRDQADALERRLRQAEQRLLDAAPSAVGAAADEPPPPHY